jgi:hypothetical protein
MSRKHQIGFGQRIKFAWMEHVGGLASSGQPADEAWQELTAYLEREISTGSGAKRGSREKVRTVLAQVWLNVPGPLVAMRQDGLALLRSLPMKDHLAVHWGMMGVVYPFWGAVAAAVGKLAALQTEIQAAQIHRRMQEQFGERETVRVSTRRVFGSFVEWGVVKRGKGKQGYVLAPKRVVTDPKLAAWLVEAVVRQAQKDLMPGNVLARAPGLFPFTLPRLTSGMVSHAGRLEVVQHGLDEEVVRLRQG